jgi:hypothetical protein
LVRSLVEMHGGSVSAHSGGVGQGTEMVVRLPVGIDDRAPLRPQETEETAAAPTTLSRRPISQSSQISRRLPTSSGCWPRPVPRPIRRPR